VYSFLNDYSESAHPRILEMLVKTNLEQTVGYGMDPYCLEAGRLILEQAQCKTGQVHFISGGTQTNLLAISSFLSAGEAVACADTGHIQGHESGAIEATGHRVVPVPHQNGKVTVMELKKALAAYTEEFTPAIGMVYLSDSTELGTIYTKAELEALSQFCRENGLILFLDGARLGSALCCAENDLTLADIARLTDAFYVGGTKNGALLGEALVIVNPKLQKNFRRIMKMRGAMLAKGKVLGIQFLELFRDGLYFQLASHANKMADLLREGMKQLGVEFYVDSPTNQLFPVLSSHAVKQLEQNYAMTFWESLDDNRQVMRLCTSWATPEQACRDFLKDLEQVLIQEKRK
jgi:threonine aldolase